MIDLDELQKLCGGCLYDCKIMTAAPDLLRELRAARAVVDAAQHYVRCPEDERAAIEEGLVDCLAAYDAARGEGKP